MGGRRGATRAGGAAAEAPEDGGARAARARARRRSTPGPARPLAPGYRGMPSSWQVTLQPSPLLRFPSSHAS
ncbi:uncharacterized protein SOCEGT47_045240 [Sorangium cellulosum]|uniref:Uncharacterized protein n=1 Tax=Sorangium cellulosum TaxID=56 RepID=A0A4P2Q4X6_SORCE|nr:uncharacterized protein SOCEGT47_045240 [Sorangium cellulosum]